MKKVSLALIALITIVLVVALTLIVVWAINRAEGNNSQESSQKESNNDLEVPLRVFVADNGATIALVPITIQGEGPYFFGLDTGASQTVIDDDIVQELNIETRGSAGSVRGIAGLTEATLVSVREWSLQDIKIDESMAITFDLGYPESGGFSGLLGSDVLSDFEAVTVDYEDAVLRLQSR